MNILITGATGNVGQAIIEALHQINHNHTLFAGIKGTQMPNTPAWSKLQAVAFDFTEPAIYKAALQDCDLLFLLRPPQIADVASIFKPLIEAAKTAGVKHIVFLSVQGVQNSSIIPHHKIERLLVDSGMAYTMLCPAYFMQNFSTTLLEELQQRQRIFLPAGKAKFTLIDVNDLGRFAAQVLVKPEGHLNQAYDLTNHETLNFGEMAAILTEVLGKKISYISPNLLRFFWEKQKAGVPSMFILVMIMLHYLPRFQKTPPTSDWIEKVTSQQPTNFRDFVFEHKRTFI